MTGKIFINYRRGDDSGNTGRLFDRLQDVFPPEQLFLDVDNIAPGLDFVQILNERVGECDILLAVIGRGWIDARDGAGNRRLDDRDDFVRIEIESALTQGKRVIPVLVGDAPMPRPEDLPEELRPLARRNAVRLTHERFRADTQGLVKALQQALAEIEERNKAQAKAEAERRAEEERRLQEAEAARRAEEKARKNQAEAATREREAQERRRQEAAAKERADVERAFAAARRANTVAAIDAFQSVYPDNHLAAEADALKAALRARADAYRGALASSDGAVLRSFLGAYKKGADADQVRARLRQLEPRPAWHWSQPAIVLPGAFVGVFVIAAAVFWLRQNSPPANQSVLALPETPSPATRLATAPAALAPAAPAPIAEARPVPTPADVPRSDQVAWLVLKDTDDDTALQRFIAEFPDSPLRQDAEARIAALASAREQAAKAAPPPAEQVAWDLVKDSKDLDQFRRFVEQFPNSAHRKDAERLMSTLPAAPAKTALGNASDPHELARSLQFELQRVGCFNGAVNGEFDDLTKAAWRQFIKLTSISAPDAMSPDAINTVRGVNKRVCPRVCPSGTHAEGESCAADPPPPPKQAAARAPAAPRIILPPGGGGGGGGGRGCRNPNMHHLPGGGCGY